MSIDDCDDERPEVALGLPVAGDYGLRSHDQIDGCDIAQMWFFDHQVCDVGDHWGDLGIGLGEGFVDF